MNDILFVDVETDGKGDSPAKGGKLTLVGWAFNNDPVRVDAPSEVPIEFWKHWYDEAVAKVSHTIFDAHWLPRHAGEWHDTRTMAWCISENTPLDLDWLVEHYVGVKMDKRLSQKGGRVLFRDDRGVQYGLDIMSAWPSRVLAEFKAYCARDVDAMRDLYRALVIGLRETEAYTYWHEEEVPYTPLLIDMERNGLPIDLKANEVLTADITMKRDASEAKLRKLARLPDAFNLGSPDQVSAYLFSKWFQVKDQLVITPEQAAFLKDIKRERRLDVFQQDFAPEGFEVTKLGRLYAHGNWVVRGRGLAPTPLSKRKLPSGDIAEGKHPSTSTPDLMYKHPADPWIRELCLTYRRANTLLHSFLEKFPRVAVIEGPADSPDVYERDEDVPVVARIHGRFNQAGTVTGRLSSSDPNMQNIPTRHEWGKLVRELFVGHFVIGDYDALEMRIMAHLSGDPELVRIFTEGLDPHERTAVAIFGSCDGHDDPRRSIGKTVNYGVGYGAGPGKLAQVLSLEGYATDQKTAREYLNAVTGFYPRFFRWAEGRKIQAKQGGGVNTMAGRRRHLRGQFATTASWKAVMYGERQAVNSEVQGSAADIIRRGMLVVAREVVKLRPLAAIHDEAIWEYDPARPPSYVDIAQVKWAMEEGHGFKMSVPLVFDPLICSSWADKGAGTESAIEMLEEEARIA